MARPTFLFSVAYLFSQCPGLRFVDMANSLVNRDGEKNTYAVYLLFHLPLAVSSIKVTLRQFLPGDAQTIIALVALVISMPPTLAVLISWWRKSQRRTSSACQDDEHFVGTELSCRYFCRVVHCSRVASISSNSSAILTVEMIALNRFPLSSESSD
ncbi:hypothetical protein V8C40DRAFT_237776 [Trichoderma camerunense]